MGNVILGTEAIAAGLVTPGQLRYGYRRLYPDVYVQRAQAKSLTDDAMGAWLWSGRRGIVTGRAAAALHGARWVSNDAPVELVYDCRRRPAGIIARNERIDWDEIDESGALNLATVARTAFDLGRHLPLNRAVAHLDALANATGLTPEMVKPLVDRYSGARGMKTLRKALELMDGGAESPKETWLRLLLMQGFPRPETQIPLVDEWGVPTIRLDMGWEVEKIAVEYDGAHHQEDRVQYVRDEKRLRLIHAQGWLYIKVIKEDKPAEIMARVRRAWALRETASTVATRAS
ncbi:hypothetical protein KXD97_15280 [Mycobacterium sp. SMC-8]|uniref:hypothetical protein n=1 Tax=Mycobacterium sp. SMC-8 TaxID=2857060 RepID=UPI0021B2E757|nr:hypothetical protein [Mycobacterium sp. SMC-8]UXA15345.1 hypothetical protein KXD97_15280 [Mycobacterium sp. SMC-8]